MGNLVDFQGLGSPRDAPVTSEVKVSAQTDGNWGVGRERGD